MKQPDLGKKIADLRRGKGLTQEELVVKCNLNVRTLQRIESGVVTPRSYTTKAIFLALKYNVNDVSEINTNTVSVIPNWGLTDRFNLKINTMERLLIAYFENWLKPVLFFFLAIGLFISSMLFQSSIFLKICLSLSGFGLIGLVFSAFYQFSKKCLINGILTIFIVLVSILGYIVFFTFGI